MGIDLPLIWAVIIAVGVMIYVVLDGFDLGIGILFPFFKEKEERDVMMNSVAPVWDGNETWLILGGAGLLGAFPLAYSVLLSALYLPLILMLIGLIFRGVAFEFRSKVEGKHRYWDWAFIGGSYTAAFMQGVALGSFILGFKVADNAYAGSSWEWVAPFPLLVGLALVFGYGLLGAGWLVLKTEGALQQRVWRAMYPLIGFAILAIGAISIVTPLIDPAIRKLWFSWPNMLYLSPLPVASLVVAGLLIVAVRQQREVWPFPLALIFFLLAYVGLGISLWPNIIPPDISIWQAASPENSQIFMLVGIVILLPLVLGYTAYSYYVFRGKVRAGDHYH